MKRLVLLFSIIAFCAEAEEPQKLLQSLRAELKVHGRTKAADSAVPDRLSGAREETVLDQILATDEDISFAMAPEAIRALTRLKAATHSGKVERLCGNLITALRERTVRECKDLQQNYLVIVRNALLKGLDATSAKELDAPLADLHRLEKRIDEVGYRSEMRDLLGFSPLTHAEFLLASYQDGLLDLPDPGTRGRWNHRRSLQQVADQASAELSALIPRSEFMEKVRAAVARIPKPEDTQPTQGRDIFEKKAVALIERVKRLEDIPAVAEQIMALQISRKSSGSNVAQYYDTSTGDSFLRWNACYQTVREGGSISGEHLFFTGANTALTNVEDILGPIIFARALRMPPDLVPKEGESATLFLQRAASHACATADWPLLSRIETLAHQHTLLTLLNRLDCQAIELFLQGIRQERAHFRADAVATYLEALGLGSPLVPVDEIDHRIQAILRDFPQDYHAGIERAETFKTSVGR